MTLICKLIVFEGRLENLTSISLPRSEEERLNTKDGIPSFRRLTRKFVFKDSKGFHCHISSVPCRYLQQGEYKYNHFVRHFRNVHTQKAREAGFFRGLDLESEDSDTDTYVYYV